MAAKVKRCEHCEAIFIPKSQAQKYCSVACRETAQRIRRPRKPPKAPKIDPVVEIEAKFAAQAERERKARLEAPPVDYLNWGQTIWARHPQGWAVTHDRPRARSSGCLDAPPLPGSIRVAHPGPRQGRPGEAPTCREERGGDRT